MKPNKILPSIILGLVLFGLALYLFGNYNNKNQKERIESTMNNVEKQHYSHDDIQRTFALLDSTNTQEIRTGIGIAMMFKTDSLRERANGYFIKLIDHPDGEIRAAALMGMYKIHSKDFQSAYALIKPDPDGLVQYSKDLIKMKN
jgi:hypothetical protein